jgi:hypothetical protein
LLLEDYFASRSDLEKAIVRNKVRNVFVDELVADMMARRLAWTIALIVWTEVDYVMAF